MSPHLHCWQAFPTIGEGERTTLAMPEHEANLAKALALASKISSGRFGGKTIRHQDDGDEPGAQAIGKGTNQTYAYLERVIMREVR